MILDKRFFGKALPFAPVFRQHNTTGWKCLSGKNEWVRQVEERGGKKIRKNEGGRKGRRKGLKERRQERRKGGQSGKKSLYAGFGRLAECPACSSWTRGAPFPVVWVAFGGCCFQTWSVAQSGNGSCNSHMNPLSLIHISISVIRNSMEIAP